MVEQVKKKRKQNGSRPTVPFREKKVMAYVYVKKVYQCEFQKYITELAKPYR